MLAQTENKFLEQLADRLNEEKSLKGKGITVSILEDYGISDEHLTQDTLKEIIKALFPHLNWSDITDKKAKEAAMKEAAQAVLTAYVEVAHSFKQQAALSATNGASSSVAPWGKIVDRTKGVLAPQDQEVFENLKAKIQQGESPGKAAKETYKLDVGHQVPAAKVQPPKHGWELKPYGGGTNHGRIFMGWDDLKKTVRFTATSQHVDNYKEQAENVAMNSDIAKDDDDVAKGNAAKFVYDQSINSNGYLYARGQLDRANIGGMTFGVRHVFFISVDSFDLFQNPFTLHFSHAYLVPSCSIICD